MKPILTFLFLSFCFFSSAQVGIGTNTPHSSAQLEVSSTDKGVLMPRLTQTQREGIAGPAAGLLVYQTDAAAGFYYYTGSTWLQVSNTENRTTPAGTIVAFAGTTAPAGWALCYGQAIDRSSNADLFGSIGTTYGAGNGSTTFNLPDLRGRSIFGLDNMGGTAAGRLGSSLLNLGAGAGSDSATLAVENLAAHTHTFTGTLISTTTNSHSHTYYDAYFAESGGSASYGGSGRYGSGASTDNDNNFRFRTSGYGSSTSPGDLTTSSNSHSHNVTAVGTNSNVGSNSAFSILNPALVLNYIIKL